VIPVADELVLETINVVVEVTEGGHRLLSHIVGGEVAGLAVFDKRITVFVLSEAKALDVGADAKLVKNGRKNFVHESTDAVAVLLNRLLSVEVGEAFTAHCASKDVLMSVDESVNASFSELSDHGFDLVQVGIVVDTFCALDSLPHDSKTDEVHAPLLEKGNILVVEGVLAIELASGGNVGVHLVDDVDAVEDHLTAKRVHERAVLGVNVDVWSVVVESISGIRDDHVGHATGGESDVSENSGAKASSFERHSQIINIIKIASNHSLYLIADLVLNHNKGHMGFWGFGVLGFWV